MTVNIWIFCNQHGNVIGKDWDMNSSWKDQYWATTIGMKAKVRAQRSRHVVLKITRWEMDNPMFLACFSSARGLNPSVRMWTASCPNNRSVPQPKRPPWKIIQNDLPGDVPPKVCGNCEWRWNHQRQHTVRHGWVIQQATWAEGTAQKGSHCVNLYSS